MAGAKVGSVVEKRDEVHGEFVLARLFHELRVVAGALQEGMSPTPDVAIAARHAKKANGSAAGASPREEAVR